MYKHTHYDKIEDMRFDWMDEKPRVETLTYIKAKAVRKRKFRV